MRKSIFDSAASCNDCACGLFICLAKLNLQQESIVNGRAVFFFSKPMAVQLLFFVSRNSFETNEHGSLLSYIGLEESMRK